MMYDNFFPNLSSIVSEKCVVTHNFLFGFWKLRSAFAIFLVQSVSVEINENRDKSRKSTKFGIHVLEGI